MIYTYIGGGDTPPRITNFMGKQEFIIGEPTEVTDPQLLVILEKHRSFKKGEVDNKEIELATEKARKKAGAQVADDQIVNAREIKRRNKK